jgi:hypothetical protein
MNTTEKCQLLEKMLLAIGAHPVHTAPSTALLYSAVLVALDDQGPVVQNKCCH